MNPRNTARLIAAPFFLFCLSVFYAVADHPLPSGFIQVVLLVLACAALVYARLGAYIKWSHTRRKHRRLLALRDGLAAGLVVALLMLLLPGRSQPGVQPRPIDGVIWAAVLGTVGAVNTLGVYILGALLTRKSRPPGAVRQIRVAPTGARPAS